MKVAAVAFTIAFAVATSSPALARAAQCPGFVGEKASPVDIDQFYAERAVSIVRAGLKGDVQTLDKLISANAKFEIWRGDYTSSARQLGVPGALEMISNLKPTGFQISAVRSGPISVPIAKCAWSAAVLFRTDDLKTGVAMKFDFIEGMLVGASGKEVVLSEGDIR